ncbi:holo-[acyl-carrier-protein] synthase SCDLUD_002145 [Saccharomycodes ludwigii]|uniref:holo-[acyl-carrier-protein] synthase n=1 Tax=Saccharomycodes ludwigii TaxID=36035 RepID=UPI001E8C4CF5|nr:hypothetical protein SCDLUD_002145 [Saccharomycodes ludwigii]KAH3902325.1 hypothetical protein SCDLUD_002145 [Saccharomycodes ludwigii]
MIYGIGVDIVYLKRFDKLLLKTFLKPALSKLPSRSTTCLNNTNNTLEKICNKFMHKNEWDYFCNQLESHNERVKYIAGVWAIKESILKTLPDGNDILLPPTVTIYTKIFYKGVTMKKQDNDFIRGNNSVSSSSKPRIIIDESYVEEMIKNRDNKNKYKDFITMLANSKFHVSLSHDGDYLIAYVVRVKDL